MMWKISVFALALLPALSAAQITRCTDPTTGKVTYTDSLCASNEKAVNVARKRTFEEIAVERAQASEARERVLREELAALREGRVPATAPALAIGIGGTVVRSADQVVDKSGTIECRQARRNLEVQQSSITGGKPLNNVSALADLQVACGVEASKYMQKLPPRITIIERRDR